MNTNVNDSYKQRILLDKLYNIKTIRESANIMLKFAQEDLLKHFNYYPENLSKTVSFVLDVMYKNYPSLNIPYHSRWRHFEVGSIDRLALLKHKLKPDEIAKAFLELTIISVMLDAGTGGGWGYHDYLTNRKYYRSEGLAVATYNLYAEGFFSNGVNKCRIDMEALQKITPDLFSTAFQVTSNNQIVGLVSRVNIITKLAEVMENNKWQTLSDILENINAITDNNKLPAENLFNFLLKTFRNIWPSRYEISEESLGDVWPHSLMISDMNIHGYIPFHKLTQWLCYSLIEPLELAGIEVTNIEVLTGLPEYRNGGLFVDTNVIVPKDPNELTAEHYQGSELIVEWRILTIALLDELAKSLREKLKLSAQQLPLAKILEGGTWAAGREIAKQLRSDFSPPIKVITDGTLF